MHIKDIYQLTLRNEKIAMLTCYDATFAKLLEVANIDMLLVGDSLGMVLKGSENTLGVTMQDMIYHTASVAAGCKKTLIMTDMPYGSYESSESDALNNARLLINAGAHIVKVEGGGHIVDIVKFLTKHQIPVCAHLGFTPQSVKAIGGYKIQGKTEESAQQILNDALAMEQAGASLMVLEMVPAALAKRITESIKIPTIGIGAGIDCDGQVLVLQDLLGIYSGSVHQHPSDFKSPRFSHNFLAGKGSIQAAVSAYINAVKNKTFPAIEHSY